MSARSATGEMSDSEFLLSGAQLAQTSPDLVQQHQFFSQGDVSGEAAADIIGQGQPGQGGGFVQASSMGLGPSGCG